jgi:alkanesulfonate monooxygenase SsuD/methylene tetrahydromethanopterin reductase-like flavin-dependent oxidoreductase (luciferase family)
MALHHPVRFAEQIALIDNISRGRMIVGVGRGTAYNFYEFRGYGINPSDAQEMLLEVEEVLVRAWTSENFHHKGKYWDIELPLLRPQVYQKPHPPIIRACSGLDSTLQMAREGRPFLMNIQSDDTTQQRLDLYKSTMLEVGYKDEDIVRNIEDSWAWRNIFVAETDMEAETFGIPYFRNMRAYLSENRTRMNTPEEIESQLRAVTGAARDSVDYGLVFGSPDTVCQKLEGLNKTGIGGVIIHFRLGEMPYELAANSLKLFAEKVAPNFD